MTTLTLRSPQPQISLNKVGSYLRDAFSAFEGRGNIPLPESLASFNRATKMPADEPSFMTPSTSEQVAREAEIMLLRAMNRSLEAMTGEMMAHRNDIGGIKTDIAVIKERQLQNAVLRDSYLELERKVDALQARNDKQDGVMSFATLLKDFGPWAVSLLLLAWGLFTRKPS